MTPREETQMRLFETRVRQLILAYKDVCDRNERLKAELAAAAERLQACEEQLEREKKNAEMLKTARMLTVSGEDQREAKARVAKMIREVDKCISLLNM